MAPGQLAGHGLAVGEPVTCRCGRDMVALFAEALWGRAGTGERIRVGDRYRYRCDACRRECDVRWSERNCVTGRRGEGATG